MNIAMISYWSCPLAQLGISTAGGMNVYILNLANILGKFGNRIDIYTRVHKENHEKAIRVNPNVKIVHLQVESSDPSKDVESFSEKMSNFINKNNIKYDIFHGHYFYSGLIGLSLIKRLKKPLIMTFHTLASIKESSLGLKEEARFASEKQIVEEASALIVSTISERNELVKTYRGSREKIHIIPPGVDHQIFNKKEKKLSRIKIQLSRDKKIILFVGRIDPIKGIIVLVEAVSKIIEKNQSLKGEIHLILIGGDIKMRSFWQNSEVIQIVDFIERQHLEQNVEFLGSKSYKLLPYYYSAADVMVTSSFYESFGFAVLEAMACGSCVLASKVGGLEYLIRDKINGRFFESGNHLDLSCKLEELLADDKQKDRLGKQAIIDSQKYCWEKQAKKIIGVYNHYI